MFLYHEIIDVRTTAFLLTKRSSVDEYGFRYGFGAEASLPLSQSPPAVSHDTAKLCQIAVTLWDCLIHADAVRDISWIFSMYFVLPDGGSLWLGKKNGDWVGNKSSASDFNIYIYIYIYILLDTLNSGKSCLIVPGVAVTPRATETVLSPQVGSWWGQDIALTFTRCMMKYIYTRPCLIY